jgi:hypothetical protein
LPLFCRFSIDRTPFSHRALGCYATAEKARKTLPEFLRNVTRRREFGHRFIKPVSLEAKHMSPMYQMNQPVFTRSIFSFVCRNSAALLLAFAATAICGTTVTAQVTEQPTQQPSATPVSTSVKKIGFRVTQWKTIHSHDATATESEMETLNRIGCEVVTANHGNHVDLRYRCVSWKTIELPTADLSAQWTQWLTEKGMETVIVNPPAETQLPTVKFRLPAEKTLHLHDQQAMQQIADTLKMVEVEVKLHSHGDHMDAKFQCPEWKSIGLVNEAQAIAWQKWLDEAGFETQHTHR